MKKITALDILSEMFDEIWDLPELKVSKEALEGRSLPEIVKHALERQYLLGAMHKDFDIIEEDRDGED